MRNVSNKSCRENQNTHFAFNIYFSENRAVCEIVWESVVQVDRPRMAAWLMRIACWITKATDTHSEYLILIAFPLQ